MVRFKRAEKAPVERLDPARPDARGWGDALPKQIVRQAPYLRRYARALTGSQAAGDRLVQSTVADLITGLSELTEDAPFRVGLYRSLQRMWKAEGLTVAHSSDDQVDRRLQALGPDQRAALLLTAMEGFSPAETALVLELPRARVEELLDLAEQEIARSLATDVMIIEDEPIIALDLTRLVRELGHRVIGTAATRSEAAELALQGKPGLVLADVRLADGSSGMDAASDVLDGVDAPVIFITAFPEHLLSGDQPEPAFLITKPFRDETVRALIAQALFFHTPRAAAVAV